MSHCDRWLRLWIVGLSLAFGGWSFVRGDEPPAADPAQEKFFEERVRPILVDRCQKCHGADKQHGELRLDSREFAITGGSSGAAVVPGRPEESLLLQAVRREDGLEMPPETPLSAEQVATLTEWVKQGAVWPKGAAVAVSPASPAEIVRLKATHWAFRPVQNPPRPIVQNANWPQRDLDWFVLAQLDRQQLAPSAPADRRTWLRRVTYDLTGLPATAAEIAAFEQDASPTAENEVVERLLASPHYGEKWARMWLDVARYADNKGYVFFEDNQYPWAYTYRDYVIEAFNRDLPYDQFIREQLAADLLPEGDNHRALRALGFLTVGGRFMNNPHDVIDDRIDVVMRGLQGLTVGCARCHDHKFDPIPTADYYSLYGVMASTQEPLVPPLYDPPPDTEEYRKFAAELADREQKLADFVQSKQGVVIEGARTRVAEYLLAAFQTRNQPRTDDFMLLADGQDVNPKLLLRWQIYLEQTARKPHPVWLPWHELTALPEADWATAANQRLAELAADKDPARRINELLLQSLTASPLKDVADLTQRYGQVLTAVDKVWLGLKQAAPAGATPASLPDAAQEEVRQVFYGADAAANVTASAIGDLDLLPDRESQGKLRELRKAIEDYRSQGPVAPPRAMAVHDLAVPFQPYVFRRGNPNNRGDDVPRQYLAVLSQGERQPVTHGSGRLELAQAIASPDNPLTARVFVNRVWLQYFGRGLVTTPSDFGTRSTPPSHPALLDYLAFTLQNNGWSLKQLQREIVLSATYRQKSDDRPEASQHDPENVWLWRMSRRRLDFEGLRDALLTAGGKLDSNVGGPSVNLLAQPGPTRRAVYGYIDRLALPGLLRTFDFPSPDTSSPQRDSTLVAPQALFLMNHPFVLEMAQAASQRPELQGAELTWEQKLNRAYAIVLARQPDPDEVELAREFFGPLEAPQTGTEPQWIRFLQALLLTNEFAYID